MSLDFDVMSNCKQLGERGWAGVGVLATMLTTMIGCVHGDLQTDEPQQIVIAAESQPLVNADAKAADAEPSEKPLQLVEFADAITLSNDRITLKVSPAAGRIVWFSVVDGPNLIWISSEASAETNVVRDGVKYRNIGGDKLWPVVQVLWDRVYGPPVGWPPDGIIDGQSWTVVSQSPRQIEIQSRKDDRLGIQVSRRIVLDDKEPVVRIHNSIQRYAPSHFPVHLWSVTQVKWPEYVLMDVAADRATKLELVADANTADRIESLPDMSAIRVKTPHPTNQGRKISTLGRWLAAVYPEKVWYQTTDFHPQGMYLDHSNVQVYSDSNYTELEMLSEGQMLKTGETLENTVVWHLEARGRKSDQQIIETARELAGKD